MSDIKMRLPSLNSHMELTLWALCSHEPEEEIHSGYTAQDSLSYDYDESLLVVGMRYKDDYSLFGANKPFESDFGRFSDMTEALLHDIEGYLTQENVIQSMRPGAMRAVNKLGGS